MNDFTKGSLIWGAVLVLTIVSLSTCDVKVTRSKYEAKVKMIEAGAHPLDIKCMYSTTEACFLRILDR